MIIDPSRLGSGSANWPLPNQDVTLERLSSEVRGDIGLVAVFGMTSVDVLHVSEAFSRMFESPDALRRNLDALAADLRSGFAERGLLSSFRPNDSRVEYTTLRDGDSQLVQVYCGERGMVVAIDADEPVESLVQAAYSLLSV